LRLGTYYYVKYSKSLTQNEHATMNIYICKNEYL